MTWLIHDETPEDKFGDFSVSGPRTLLARLVYVDPDTAHSLARAGIMHRGPVIPIEVELKGGKDEELRATNARDIILTVDSPGPISDVMIFEVDPFTIRALLPIGSINLHTAGTVGIDARRLDLRLS